MSETRRQILEQLLDLERRAESLRRRLDGQDSGSSFDVVPVIEDKILHEIHRLVVDNLAEAMLAVSPQGIILAASWTARRMFGLSRRGFGQQSLRDVCGDLIDRLGPQWSQDLFEKGTMFHQGWIDIEGTRRDIELLMISIPHPSTPCHCFLLRDVTAQRQAERERDRLVEQLRAKHRELESFTYRVSHDLKTPLVTIGGFSNLLKKDLEAFSKTEDPAIQRFVSELQDHAEEIGKGVIKAHRLVDQLLDLARVGQATVELEEQDLQVIVDRVLRSRAPQVRENGIQVEVQRPLGKTWGDHQQLLTIFENLIDNALRFLAGRPSPKLTVGRRLTPNGQAWFVQDNGPGVAVEQAERVFDLFVRFDRNHKGSGIGLALVRRIVDAHGGQIWLESETGQGATFFFTLAAEQPIRE